MYIRLYIRYVHKCMKAGLCMFDVNKLIVCPWITCYNYISWLLFARPNFWYLVFQKSGVGGFSGLRLRNNFRFCNITTLGLKRRAWTQAYSMKKCPSARSKRNRGEGQNPQEAPDPLLKKNPDHSLKQLDFMTWDITRVPVVFPFSGCCFLITWIWRGPSPPNTGLWKGSSPRSNSEFAVFYYSRDYQAAWCLSK